MSLPGIDGETLAGSEPLVATYKTQGYRNAANGVTLTQALSGAGAGDFIVVFNLCSKGSIPVEVIPAGWTEIMTVSASTDASQRATLLCKAVTAADVGATWTFMERGTWNQIVWFVFSGSEPITGFEVNNPLGQLIANAPTNQVQDATTVEAPVVIVGAYEGYGSSTLVRGFTPAADLENGSDSDDVYFKYKLYNPDQARASHTLSLNDTGAHNTMLSAMLHLTA